MEDDVGVCHSLEYLIGDGAEPSGEVGVEQNDDLHVRQHVDPAGRRQTGAVKPVGIRALSHSEVIGPLRLLCGREL